jgi:hypothetical protein
MRTETFPRESNKLEKAAFLASCIGAIFHADYEECYDDLLKNIKINDEEYGFLTNNSFKSKLIQYESNHGRGHMWAIDMALTFCTTLQDDVSIFTPNTKLESQLYMSENGVLCNKSPSN